MSDDRERLRRALTVPACQPGLYAYAGTDAITCDACADLVLAALRGSDEVRGRQVARFQTLVKDWAYAVGTDRLAQWDALVGFVFGPFENADSVAGEVEVAALREGEPRETEGQPNDWPRGFRGQPND